VPNKPVPVKPAPVKPAPIVKPAPVKPAPIVKPAPVKPAPIVKPAPVKPAKPVPRPAPKKPAPKPVKPTPKPVKQPSRKPSVKPSTAPTLSPTAMPTQPPIARQCLGTSCGTLEENIDYPGNDITSVSTSDLQGCCDKCNEVEGCVVYSWSSDGTCYLKSEKSFPVVSTGIHSAVRGTSFCSFIENDIDYYENEIGYVSFFNTASVEDCCISCRLYTGCKYFTYFPDGQDCWLQSSDANKRSSTGAVSGSVHFPF
jgi:hypothetical protein